MPLHYDEKNDILNIILNPSIGNTVSYEAGNIAAFIDDNDALTVLEISNASDFIKRALAAGIKIEGTAVVPPPKDETIWQDADSSMISAFGYNEATNTLEIAYNRTGVYCYFDVPLHVVEELRNSSSKGSFIRDMIIDLYDYEKRG